MHSTNNRVALRGGSALNFRRGIYDRVATLVASLMAIGVLIPLFAILGYVIYKGIGSLDLKFFTNIPAPVGQTGGGMANAIVGSMMLLGLAGMIGVPVGILAGVYLAEFGHQRFANYIRFFADVLNGVPSIVVGIAVYGLIVFRTKQFSMLSGGVALGIMMIPVITRATEEILRMLPNSIREAALGLGLPRWKVTMVMLRTGMSGIITGCMLAFARVAGETAPLLFTAFGNAFWNFDPRQPTAALPIQIFAYAISPFEEWHRKAWAGALVLITFILFAVSLVRYVTSRGVYQGAR